MRKAKKLLKWSGILLLGFVVFVWIFGLPKSSFKKPTCTIIESKDGELLSVKIASDAQWRFPIIDSLPEEYINCLISFEDRHFFKHPGVNPFALLRAIRQNIKAGRIVSGGSTITMQCVRMLRGNRKRNLWNKLLEAILAAKLELTNSKKEILELYASHAPFGGNIVGFEAACWRYYGRGPGQLSLAEYASLAVLPNAPALIYPGKNESKLLAKRNRLLDKMEALELIDEETCGLSKDEPIPLGRYPIARNAPHLLERFAKNGKTGMRIRSTIDFGLQQKVNALAENEHQLLHQNEIHNLAVFVVDIETGEVIAYRGNSDCPELGSGKDVDIIQSLRSTGSILKPFLYHGLLRDGNILPKSLVEDIPTNFGGYSPQNFNEHFEGAVPADEALSRSLNIPAIRLLREYGVEKFHGELKQLGINTMPNGPRHYGLSLVLGGAEGRLDEMSRAYMNLARSIQNKQAIDIHFSSTSQKNSKNTYEFDRGAAWWIAEALLSLNRPESEFGWDKFNSARKIAWKTGTSFGHRDAWSIGFTKKYLVGVWVGNADGEGRPGLTGTNIAAPIMFKTFGYLAPSSWFDQPMGSLKSVLVCTTSGYKAQTLCAADTLNLPFKSEESPICPFHTNMLLDETEEYRVNGNCYPVGKIHQKSWFVLPPVQAYYYKVRNPLYQQAPKLKSGCSALDADLMQMIYPIPNAHIKLPRNLDGVENKLVFELSHSNSNTEVHWHLDGEYLGSTKREHKIEASPSQGWHKLTCVDMYGEIEELKFEIL